MVEMHLIFQIPNWSKISYFLQGLLCFIAVKKNLVVIKKAVFAGMFKLTTFGLLS